MRFEDRDQETRQLLTRRDAIGRSVKTVAALSLPGVIGCKWSASDRNFFLQKVFEWSPADVAKDVAFAIVPATGAASMDYLDAQCQHCRTAFRVFLFGANLATQFAVTCPACPPNLRLAVVVSKALVSELRRYAIKRAVGLATRGGYQIHRVGRVGQVAVSRSAASYDLKNKEPRQLFQREVPAVPDRIFYFTEVVGIRGRGQIFHSWRKDGQLTDRIPLEVNSKKWRTHTYKENLAPGAWILTAETPSGDILDVREFHIG